MSLKFDFFNSYDKFHFFQEPQTLADLHKQVQQAKSCYHEANIGEVLEHYGEIENLLSKEVTEEKYKLLQDRIRLVEVELATLPSNNTLNQIHHTMKEIVIDLGLAGNLSLKAILQTKKGNVENLRKCHPELENVLGIYSSLIQKIETKGQAKPDYIRTVRESVDALIGALDLSLLNEDSRAGLSALNETVLNRLMDNVKESDPIDLIVSLSYVQNALSNPVIIMQKQAESVSQPELKTVKGAYQEALESLKNTGSCDLTAYRSALLQISDQWQALAAPLIAMNKQLAKLLEGREQIDTKRFFEIKKYIEESQTRMWGADKIKTFVAEQIADASPVEKAIKKIGLTENSAENNQMIAQRIDPARFFQKQFYRAHGAHADYGVNLDSVVDYFLDHYGKKIPALESLKGPLKALIKEKAEVLASPVHLHIIMTKFLDDVTAIVNQLAQEATPEGYEEEFEIFARKRYAAISASIINIIQTSSRTSQKTRWFDMGAKWDAAKLKLVKTLLESDFANEFLTKKLMSDKLIGKASASIEMGKEKLQGALEKKSEKSKSKHEIFRKYIEGETRLDQFIEDFGDHGEKIVWDLLAKLMQHIDEEIEHTCHPASRIEALTAEIGHINHSYNSFVDALGKYFFYGENDLGKTTVMTLIRKYKDKVDPADIVDQACSSISDWIDAEAPKPMEVHKHKKLDENLLYLANKNYLDARLKLAEVVIESSSNHYTAQDAFDHLKIALKQAKKPKDIRRALQSLATFYQRGLGVEKDEKMAAKLLDQLKDYPD